MIPGKRYRVIIKGAGTTKPREFVGAFMAEEADKYFFDLRPKAGTATVLKRDVHRIYTTVHTIMLPRIYRPETRVL